jgi:hypothetical protein
MDTALKLSEKALLAVGWIPIRGKSGSQASLVNRLSTLREHLKGAAG